MAEPTRKNAGSEENSEPAFVLIARLQKAHGVRGEIEARLMGDYASRLRVGRKVYIGEDHQSYKIASARPKHDLVLLRFEGIGVREDVALLTNSMLYSLASEMPKLRSDQFYDHELIGLSVYEGDRLLGELTEILKTGANDVYIVRKPDGKDLLLPAIPQVVLEIRLEDQRMQVALMEGLDE